MSYVLAFPLDRIKIDRSFTIGLGLQERASILVESVAQMCAKLGMSVLVEGVETDLQLRFIERVGSISEVQGFYFSPAVPELEARSMVAEKKRLNVGVTRAPAFAGLVTPAEPGSSPTRPWRRSPTRARSPRRRGARPTDGAGRVRRSARR